MTLVDLFMFGGFVIAAYSIVANDAIQTLGTFLSSNAHRPWWVLWAWACSVLVAVLVYGWVVNFGDVAYGRLEKFPPPEGGITWIHAIPPIFLLILTRYGVPVSTTFLILTVFAPGNLGGMFAKSMIGYAVALVVGIAVYVSFVKTIELRFLETADHPPGKHWIVLQWLATAFLWSQWLVQDLANIFVYLPRTLSLQLLVLAVILMLCLHAWIFYRRGGAIQHIVTSKTNTLDIRSATFIDFIYGVILLVFKEASNLPMSTTWVFLGLLAGREIALTVNMRHRDMRETLTLVAKDGSKALAGLAVSVALAYGLPALQRALSPALDTTDDAVQKRDAVPMVQVLPGSED
ncbi:MAG: hypothetical protein V2I63_09380 [Pseudomonadales bacterium]|jgi:hypothetical protein|nr:hypothetical protein [Pseudomonadales bacterium]